MGYSFFKITRLQKPFRDKLSTFVNTLGSAIRDGKTISFADNDIGHVLQLQNERLKKKGLVMDYVVYDRDKNRHATVGSQWKDAHYESFVCNEQYGVKRTITKNGQKIYSDNKRNTLYTTITDVINGVHPNAETVCCPNCGSVSTIAQLQGGCPSCGTRYKMDDLFPKVTGYYFLEDVAIAGNEFIKGMVISAGIAYVFNFFIMLISLLISGEGSFLKVILGMVVLVPLSIFLGYVLFSIFMMVRLIAVGSSQSSGKWGTIGSRTKFEEKMKTICPEFSYEYFTSKAISLIKTAIYSENEQELMFYKGGPLDPKFKDVIDLNYGAALGLESFTEENGFVTVAAKAYFDVLYATDNGIKFQRDMYGAVFRRRTDIPVDMGFSMTKIQCPACGSSFNAMKNKVCPYCGNIYDIESDDWVLVRLER